MTADNYAPARRMGTAGCPLDHSEFGIEFELTGVSAAAAVEW